MKSLNIKNISSYINLLVILSIIIWFLLLLRRILKTTLEIDYQSESEMITVVLWVVQIVVAVGLWIVAFIISFEQIKISKDQILLANKQSKIDIILFSLNEVKELINDTEKVIEVYKKNARIKNVLEKFSC